MPGQVYAVASGKGGVGKTTTVVNLGVALRVEGHSVALVDADLGMANVAAFLGVDHEPTVHDVLADDAAVADAVTESAEGFAVVPGDRSLDAFAAADPAGLGAVIEHVAERYDVVLVDTGAGVGYEEILPLGLVDGVVLVTTPDPAAAGDTRKTAQLVDRLGRSVRGVVVNRADEEIDGEDVATAIGAQLLGVVPEDPVLTESNAAGTPVRSRDPEAPSVAAFTRLAKRLLGEEPAPAEGERDDAPVETAASAASAASDRDGSTASDGEAVSAGANDGEESHDEQTVDAGAEADAADPGAPDPATASDGAAAEAGDTEPDGADEDDEPTTVPDADDETGFVTTGASRDDDATDGDAVDEDDDAGSGGTEPASETVRAEGDDGATAADEDEDEDSGGLFSWFR